MDKDKLKLTSSEIGTLWGEYVNGTSADIVNKYMFSIIEDEAIKAIFEDAIITFEKQKNKSSFLWRTRDFQYPLDFLKWIFLKINRDYSQIYFA